MRYLLICPSHRTVSRLLARSLPLSNVPMLGWSLVEYWLSHLANLGNREVEEVVLLACDRPEQVEALVSGGARWNLRVNVRAVPLELTPEQALEEFGKPGTAAKTVVLDNFPDLAGPPLLAGWKEWFQSLLAWMPNANRPDRVGIREMQPGIWCGLHGRISSRAVLIPPCWIDESVFVGPGAVVGPEVVLERGAFVEAKAKVAHSVIGPDTLVGREVGIRNSVAWGNTLLDLETASEMTVTDAFILSSLHRPFGTRLRSQWRRLLNLRQRVFTESGPLVWSPAPIQEHRPADSSFRE